MRARAVALACALALGAAGGGPVPARAASPGLLRAAGAAPRAQGESVEVRREWAVRARALSALGGVLPLLGAVPEPDGAFLGEGWRGTRSALEALRRARRFADVAAPAGAVHGLAGRPGLAAVAIAAARTEEAGAAIERGVASSFGAVRAAAAERLARALHGDPELRACAFPAPAGGRDRDASEAIARARARAGLAGGAVPAWLAAEAALGLAPGAALRARFDDLVRAPLDAAAIEDLRAAGVDDGARWLVELLANFAALRDGAEVAADLDVVRAGLGREGLDFELASALFGAVDAAARAGQPGVGAPIGEALLALGRAETRRDLLTVAARLLPDGRAVAAARSLGPPALRAAFVEALEARDLPLDPEPFAAWLAEDLASGREDAEWILELASRRYQYGGQPRFGALLAAAVLAEDAWSDAHRASTLDRIADLTRAASAGEYADAVAGAYRAAPPDAREEIIARIYPGPGARALGPELAARIDAVPARAAPRNTFEVAARCSSDGVRAALLGAFRRSVDALEAVEAGDDDAAAAADALVQQAGTSLLAAEPDAEARAAVAGGIARIHAASGGRQPRSVAPLLERLGAAAVGDSAGLAPLLAPGVDPELRGRVAEVVVSGAARAALAGVEHDEALARDAAALLADALVREARAPGGQPIGRTTAMFRALTLATAEHLPRGQVLRVLDAGLGSPRTPLALLALDLAVARGEVGAVLAALRAPARDPLTGERALALGRSALRGLDEAWRRGDPGDGEAAAAAAIIAALAALPPSEEPDGDYAVELLRGEAIAAAARLVGGGLLARESDARATLEGVVEGLFDASLARSARATRARLDGREQATVLMTPDPSVRGFEVLGGRAGAQRAALLRAPDVLARLDARVLAELAAAASDPEVAASLWIAADVAREGERPGRDADRREAALLVGLLRAGAEGRSDAVAAVARGAAATLLGRMRSGALPPRGAGLALSGPLVGSGADALALIAAEAWRARTPESDLERSLRRAFLRSEPAPR